MRQKNICFFDEKAAENKTVQIKKQYPTILTMVTNLFLSPSPPSAIALDISRPPEDRIGTPDVAKTIMKQMILRIKKIL